MKPNVFTRPTIQDVARHTNLSIATVSRALHLENSPNVSEQTRERVRVAAQELGYQTNLMGRSLVKGRSNTISYWSQNIFSSYYMMITEQVCYQAAQRKYHVMINSAHDLAHTYDGVGAGFGNPLAANYDGIIGCDVSYDSNQYAEQLLRQNRPFVGIGLNTSPRSDSVTIDVGAAGRMALRHLIEAGAQRVALLTTLGDGDPRTLAYSEVMKEAGRELIFIPLSEARRPSARDSILSFVAEQKSLGRALPDAIFCKTDETAIGCYRALCELGIRVPDDILLVGCDGLEDAAFQACPISTIEFPIAEMCNQAWDVLELRLQDNEAPLQQIVLQPKLVVRQSSQPNYSKKNN